MGLLTSSSVGGYDYLHYWFKNTGMDVQDFSQAKKQALERHITNYRDRQQLMISGDVEEGFKILEDISSGKLIGNELDAKIGEYFNSNGTLPTGASDSGLGGSYAQIGAKIATGQTRGLATQLINSAGQCQIKLQEALDQIVSIFGVDYPKYVDLALAGANQVINNSTYQEILQNFMTSGYKFVEIPSDQNISSEHQAVIQSIAKLRIAIDAIPMLNSKSISVDQITVTHSHSKAHGVKNRSELISVFFGKVGGILSGLSGPVEELAVGHGLEICIKMAGEEFVKTKAFFVGGKCQIDPNSEKDANIQLTTGVFNKNDVTLQITKDKVILTFGVSVKHSNKTDKRGIPLSIKLHDGTNLLEALQLVQSHGVTAPYIYNLAGGIEEGYNGSLSLAQGWKSLVDYAVALNFMDYLVGQGFANNNNLILVANRQIYSMKDILTKVANNPDSIAYTGGKQRHRFWHINRDNWVSLDAWAGIDKNTAAEYRSAKTILDLTHQFIATKMIISLNFAMII